MVQETSRNIKQAENLQRHVFWNSPKLWMLTVIHLIHRRRGSKSIRERVRARENRMNRDMRTSFLGTRPSCLPFPGHRRSQYEANRGTRLGKILPNTVDFYFFIRLIILEDFIRLISYNGPCVRLGCSFFLATALPGGCFSAQTTENRIYNSPEKGQPTLNLVADHWVT